MKDSLYHTLFKLVTQGPQPSTNCVSITGITEATKLGLVTVVPVNDVDWYRITSGGIQTLLEAYERRPDPEQTIFGALYVQRADRTDEAFAGQPIVILGGAQMWAMEHLLGCKLTFSVKQPDFEYAVFDYLDLDGKTWLMQPGDWLILSEDNNHVLHQYYNPIDEEENEE